MLVEAIQVEAILVEAILVEAILVEAIVGNSRSGVRRVSRGDTTTPVERWREAWVPGISDRSELRECSENSSAGLQFRPIA